MLKQEYKDTPTLSSALDLAVKVLYKTLDSTKLNSEKGRCVCVCVCVCVRVCVMEAIDDAQ